MNMIGMPNPEDPYEAAVLLVRHSYDDFGNLKASKTEAGVRLLPLPEFTREALLKRKAAQLAMVPEDGAEGYTRKGDDGTPDLVDTLPVTADAFGERMKPQVLSSWWTYRRDNFGADKISLHQLRHTFLSLAAEQGVHPSVKQKLAGHASPVITMKIYTHVNVEAKKSAMDALQNAYMKRDAKAS